MNARRKVVTAALGPAVGIVSGLALLVLGAGTAQATPGPEDGVGLPYVEQHPANTWSGVVDPGSRRPSHDHGTTDGGVIAIIAPAPHLIHH